MKRFMNWLISPLVLGTLGLLVLPHYTMQLTTLWIGVYIVIFLVIDRRWRARAS